jgi:hypothetical protein
MQDCVKNMVGKLERLNTFYFCITISYEKIIHKLRNNLMMM